MQNAGEELLQAMAGRRFGAILADPPWQFQNRTGKVAPGHKRLNRYETLTLREIMALPVKEIADAREPLVSVDAERASARGAWA